MMREESISRRTTPVVYAASTGFHAELKRQVDAYFVITGRSRRGLPMIYIKTAILLCWVGASYWLLIFCKNTALGAIMASLSLGFAIAGFCFNVCHDANHGAYSSHRAINRWMSTTLDLFGGSSYVWKWKHNYLHHNYTNIIGVDDDINIGIFGRLSADGRSHAIHRYQHLYLWLIYGFFTIYWQFFLDFKRIIKRRIGTQYMPRPKGWELLVLIIGKAGFIGLAFVIPSVLHPLATVAIFYGLVSVTLGWTMALVFQLAHCVEEANFPDTGKNSSRVSNEWAAHQVGTTVDFSRSNRLLTWYMGGLNFQVEHHLFPNISHLHYPAVSAIVERTCSQFGVRYSAHRTIFDAVASHYRFLRLMGARLG